MQQQRDSLTVIPCRLGSRRFPGKPLAEVCGKPLFWWVWDSVRRWERAIETIIATPDEEILAKATELGVPARFTAATHRNGSLRCLQVLHEHPRRDAVRFLVNVQGDQLEATPAILEALVGELDERCPGGIATASVPFRNATDRLDPNCVKVVAADAGKALYFTRQPLPASARHVGVYAFSTHGVGFTIVGSCPNALSKAEGLEQLEWLGAGADIQVVPVDGDPLSIDTPQDIVRLERKLRGRINGAEV